MILLGQRHSTAASVIVAVTMWMVLLCNFSFFSNVLGAYPLSAENLGFIFSLGALLACLTVLLLVVFAVGPAFKPVLIAILLVTSLTAYFMDSYNVIISTEVIESMLQTDTSESAGLLNLKLVLYLGVLGLLPALCVYRTRLQPRSTRAEFVSRLKLFGGALAVVIALLGMFNNAYASFFREHKSVRFYTNPITPVYTAATFLHGKFGGGKPMPYQQLGLDARQVADTGKRRLVILVVGETARQDHFSLNGYPRETNPLLASRQVTSFDDVWSCGTATAISVPCMFSVLDRGHYGERQARNTDNVLDILQRAGVNVAWLDNNSDSKGVAVRIPYTSYRSAELNRVCDTECRDEGMLVGVEKFVGEQTSGDILIVLHQMGSHGPEYAKRYPAEFEHFSPSCHSNLLENCTAEEIRNAYDNSIRYTDYFLNRVIGYLESQSKDFAPVMLYLSDHGESLGESGIYLHGFPYALAPEEQKHVPMIMWVGAGYPDVQQKLADGAFAHQKFSQDNLFHTLLGLMSVRTAVYQPDLDMFGNG
ncbi:phosphoethanolamine transferase [Microbulbifer aggregans]|uniref:phosphoethanolamine transferase n=1 Tax=Microbulbifer aggregans TaxID=1769779 RepID=UPI001CFD7BDB|nr:phosphoethanolamine--lipid A transferase [Microbulbifer aggregans]